MGIKKITSNVSLISTLLLGGVGCQQSIGPEKKVYKSPVTASELGMAVQVDSESQLNDLLDAHPQAKVRVINTVHGLYEIHGISSEVLIEELGEDSVAPNELVEPITPLQTASEDQLQLHDAASENAFNPCRPTRSKPEANIRQLRPRMAQNTSIFDLGEQVHLSASGSRNHRNVQGSLKKAWVIEAPAGSHQASQQAFGNELAFQPDSVGLYQVLLIVQDSNDACHITAKNFIITDNKPLADSVTPLSRRDVEGLDLYHLSQINAQAAWRKSEGEGITIAIVDSGVNYNHPALHSNIAVNTAEIPGNNRDDDQNGYVDDVVGYDFNNSDPFPFDDSGHGTHVAGLAASPVLGVAPKAKILPLKVLNDLGGDQASLAGAIFYAVDRKVQIINLSLGNYGRPHQFVMRAIKYARTKGVLVVAAAGNGHPYTGQPINTDRQPNYPSALPYDNILAVAASSKQAYMADYSNYGKISVDLTAPGGDNDDPLISAAMANAKGLLFEAMSGTSMASPVTAGAAAVVMSLKPDLSPQEVSQLLMSSGDRNPRLSTLTASGKELNLERAVAGPTRVVRR